MQRRTKWTFDDLSALSVGEANEARRDRGLDDCGWILGIEGPAPFGLVGCCEYDIPCVVVLAAGARLEMGRARDDQLEIVERRPLLVEKADQHGCKDAAQPYLLSYL